MILRVPALRPGPAFICAISSLASRLSWRQRSRTRSIAHAGIARRPARQLIIVVDATRPANSAVRSRSPMRSSILESGLSSGNSKSRWWLRGAFYHAHRTPARKPLESLTSQCQALELEPQTAIRAAKPVSHSRVRYTKPTSFRQTSSNINALSRRVEPSGLRHAIVITTRSRNCDRSRITYT